MSVSEITKRPLKFVEIAVNNFKEVAVPHHLQLISKHKDAFQQVHSDINKMRSEQATIKRTEAQLKGLLYELDTLRAQVQDSDLDKFDIKTLSLRKTILQIINDYKELSKLHSTVLISTQQNSREIQEINFVHHEPLQLNISANLDEMKINEKEVCLQNVENINNDIQDLHSMYGDLHQMVHGQGENVDKVENNVEIAQENVNIGNRHLITAARLKTSIYPVTGAIMGGCVGGPVGLLAGLKFGGLAALGCGCLGYTGGYFFKKHRLNDDILQSSIDTNLNLHNENIECKKDE